MRFLRPLVISGAVAGVLFGAFVFFANAACGQEFYQFPRAPGSPFEEGLFLHSCAARGSVTRSPASCAAPCTVTITITPSGTVYGYTYRYYFDWTNDGTWDATKDAGYAGTSLAHTYSAHGNYTARGGWAFFWYGYGGIRWTGLSATIGITPGAPGTPTFSNVGATTMRINWTAPSSGASSYKLYRCAGAGCSPVLYASGITTTYYDDSGLTGNTLYRYQVRGTGPAGDGPLSGIGEQLTLPGVPGTPTFSNITETSLTVSWNAPSGGAPTYKLERCQGAGCTGFVQIVVTSSTSYNDSGLTPGAIYRYRVRGNNATGDGNYSGIGTSGTAPSAPTGFTGTAQNENTIVWTWNSSSGATYYEVRSHPGESLIGTTTLLFLNQTVTPFTSYTNKVRACNEAGCGSYSGTDVESTILNAPTSFSGTPLSGGTSIRWSWNDNSNYEDGYRIKRCSDNQIMTSAGANATSKDELNLSPLTGYCRYAVAFNANGESNASNQANATTGAAFVSTGWLESAIFDTQKVGGVAYNFIKWIGTRPSGTSVEFQIASSNNSSGPWTFVGPDCGTGSRYTGVDGVLPNTQVRIAAACHTGHRYFRYKIYLNGDGVSTPTVTDVILGWSP